MLDYAKDHRKAALAKRKRRHKRTRLQDTVDYREDRFVAEYLKDFIGAKAIVRCGFAESGNAARVMAHCLLNKPSVQAKIKQITKDYQHQLGVNVYRVLREWANIAFLNVENAMGKDGNENPYLDMDKLTSEQMAAVSEIEDAQYVERNGKRIMVRRPKVKFHSKTVALEALSKHLGLFQLDNDQRNPLDALGELIRKLQDGGTSRLIPGHGPRLADGEPGEPDLATGAPVLDSGRKWTESEVHAPPGDSHTD